MTIAEKLAEKVMHDCNAVIQQKEDLVAENPKELVTVALDVVLLNTMKDIDTETFDCELDESEMQELMAIPDIAEATLKAFYGVGMNGIQGIETDILNPTSVAELFKYLTD